MQHGTATSLLLALFLTVSSSAPAPWIIVPPAGTTAQQAANAAAMLGGTAVQQGGQMARSSKKQSDKKKQDAMMAMAAMQMMQAGAAKSAEQKNKDTQDQMKQDDGGGAKGVPSPPPLEDPKLTFKGPEEAKVQIPAQPPQRDGVNVAPPSNAAALAQLVDLSPAPLRGASAGAASSPPAVVAAKPEPRRSFGAERGGPRTTPPAMAIRPASAELAVLSTSGAPAVAAVGNVAAGRDILSSLDTGNLLPEGRGVVETESSEPGGRIRTSTSGEGEGSAGGSAPPGRGGGGGRSGGVGDFLGDLLSSIPPPPGARGRGRGTLGAGKDQKKVFANLFEAASDRFRGLQKGQRVAMRRATPKEAPHRLADGKKN